MKIDLATIIALIQRKGITMVSSMALGAVICATQPQILALVQQAVGILGVSATIGIIVSTLMSVKNVQQNKADVQTALMTPVPTLPSGESK